MMGPDYLLESLLRLAGVDVEKAKVQILTLGQKFTEQDGLLRQIANDQKTILAQQAAIIRHFEISVPPPTPGVDNGQIASAANGSLDSRSEFAAAHRGGI